MNVLNNYDGAERSFLIDLSSENTITLKLPFYPYTFNERDNWFSRLFFLHLIRYFHAIRSNIVLKGKTMKMNDLPRLSKNESILDNYLNTKFEVNYETTPWKLGIALFFGDLRSKTFLVLSLYILESVIRQGISLVLSALIQAVLTNQEDTSYNYAILLTGLSILSTLIRNHSVYQAIELSAKARFTLMNLVYDKLTILNKNYITGEFAGRIIILASADLNALEQYLLLIFQICVAPVSFILGSIVLCLRFQGPIGLAGIGVLVIIQPIEVFLHHMAIKYTKQAKVYQDERLKLQNEMIQGAKTLKMYAWEEVLVKKITELRRKEVKYHLRSYLLQVLDRTFAFSSQVWGSCAFFAIIYFGNYNQKLTVEDMISTIQLQQFLKQSCVMSISQGLQSFNNIKLIFERLLEIIKAQQFSKQTLDTIKPRNLEESDYLVKLVRYTAYWDNDNDRVPVLQDINMTIRRGDFISLVGRVGSGKSTLLQSIVNQVPYYVGMINHDIKLGYVEQDPYIFQDTIQQNIIFGQPCYQEIYQHVLSATSLDTDLSKMAQGDQTMIGDRGQTLSGGQKTRLSLARALYALPDLYVLDDPFSALDQRVVNEIMKNAIQDYIFEYQVNKQSKTPAVILATHHMSVAKHSAIKITLEDGQIVDHKLQDKSDESSGEQTPPARQGSKKTILGNEPSRYLLRQGQRIKELDVDYHTSLRYFKYWCNWPLLLLILSMNIATEVIYNLYYRIVSDYSVYESNNQIDQMFIIMSLYTAGVLLNNFIKYFITLNGQFVATNRLHKHMLRSLSNAPLTYVEQNKASAILGKFSSDLSIADHPTLICLFDLFEFSSQFMASLVVLVILEPIFSIFMVITLLLNLAIYRLCRDFIIQTKELDLQAKSGMGDIFRKTVNGLHLIQVYRQQNWFKQEFMKQSNICLLCNFTFHYAQRLFAYYIDLVGLLVQIVGIFTLISLDLTTSQEFAQAMLLLLTFNQNQQWCLRQFLTFGTQMSNFNRIFGLIDVASEQNRYQPKDKKVIFPNEGAIDFSQVFMRYQQDAEYVLKDLTFKIQPGQSVGFIGRTGTGKSSILQVLYRMVEVEAADRLLIDGIDIRELGLAKVRSSFGLIPQYPFIFTGTIRDNIDPYQNYQDVIILEAIAQVQLLDYIQNLKDGINTVISSSDFLLSFGQKQLICLARVLVQNPKIIIMDEGTANLDEFTDVLIQDAIKRDFKNKTVITIAHRLSTIAGYDRIFVMENGAVIQSGIPLELLISWQKVEAVKCRAIEVLSVGDLSEDSAFANMVLNTGVEKATQIIQQALEAYLKMK